MGSELNRVMQKYSVPNQGMAQALGAMGRHGDSLVAHITPEEAMLLKSRGGAGTTNPLTGMLEFYDADGNGNATDSSNPTGGEGSGGESSADTSAYDPGDPSFGSSVDFGGSGFSGGGFGSDPNNGGGGYNTNVGVAAAPVATTAPGATTGAASNTATGATPANTFKFAPYTPPASYGFELNRLMQQYGVSTPSMMPYGGMAAPTSPEENTRYEYDKTAHTNYANQFNDRLAKGNMYNQQQFTANPASYTPQFPNVLANPVYSPANYTDVSNTYNKYFNRPAEEAAVKYWGDTGLKGEQLQNAIVGGAQNSDAISGIYNKYFGRPAEAAAYDYWGGFGLQGDALRRAILSGAQNSDLSYFQQNYPNYSYARGGAVKPRYAEGGEVEEPETERSNRAPLTPEGAARMAALLNQMRPTTNYGAQLAGAQQAARGETEAFSNMIRQMSERAESPTSRAEMYFRLASAFGAPTRTGMFTENLGLAGREMGEYARGRRTDEAERRALALRAQELRMAGARQDLASLQTLAGQEAAAQRAINLRMIDAQMRGATPNARETRINDTMQTLNVDRPTAIRIVDNIIVAVPGSAGEPPTFFDRSTNQIIVPGGVTQPAPSPAAAPTETATPPPAAAPAQAEAPAIDLRRPQAAAATAPTTSAPTSVEDLYAGRRQRQVEQAGRTAEAEALGRVSAPPAPRQDFRYTQDFQAVEPIPGSVAAREATDREKAERVRRESEQQAGFTVMRAIDDAERTIRTAVLPTTGFFAERLSGVGGTAARNLRADLETIRANIGFDQLNQMRQASPTGGALGNVTNQELTFLQSVMGSVDQSQSEDQFLRNLRRLRDAFEEVIHYGRGNRPPVQIPGPGGRGTAEPPPREGASDARRPAAGAAPTASGEIRLPSGLTIRPLQ
jgi:hypothetical protein